MWLTFWTLIPKPARERKPEYPVEFLHKCRQCLSSTGEYAGYLTVIPPMALEDAKKRSGKRGRICDDQARSGNEAFLDTAQPA